MLMPNTGSFIQDAFIVGGAFAMLGVLRLLIKGASDLYYGKPSTPPPVGEAGFTELMLCAGEGDIEGCKRLLEQGGDINKQDDKGGTALIYAVMNKREAVVDLLLTKGADVNIATNKKGQTALSIAKNSNYKAIVKRLESNLSIVS
jgi:ankyrin repeat protein